MRFARLTLGAFVLAACGSAAVVANTRQHLAGAVDPRVTQANLAATICRVGYTSTIRPPLTYTQPIKLRLWRDAGAPGRLSDYVLDHLVPLEVGGAPSSSANLVLEPRAESYVKDRVEDRVHREVCAHTLTLRVGERCFRVDWRKCP